MASREGWFNALEGWFNALTHTHTAHLNTPALLLPQSLTQVKRYEFLALFKSQATYPLRNKIIINLHT